MFQLERTNTQLTYFFLAFTMQVRSKKKKKKKEEAQLERDLSSPIVTSSFLSFLLHLRVLFETYRIN